MNQLREGNEEQMWSFGRTKQGGGGSALCHDHSKSSGPYGRGWVPHLPWQLIQLALYFKLRKSVHYQEIWWMLCHGIDSRLDSLEQTGWQGQKELACTQGHHDVPTGFKPCT